MTEQQYFLSTDARHTLDRSKVMTLMFNRHVEYLDGHITNSLNALVGTTLSLDALNYYHMVPLTPLNNSDTKALTEYVRDQTVVLSAVDKITFDYTGKGSTTVTQVIRTEQELWDNQVKDTTFSKSSSFIYIPHGTENPGSSITLHILTLVNSRTNEKFFMLFPYSVKNDSVYINYSYFNRGLPFIPMPDELALDDVFNSDRLGVNRNKQYNLKTPGFHMTRDRLTGALKIVKVYVDPMSPSSAPKQRTMPITSEEIEELYQLLVKYTLVEDLENYVNINDAQ